MKKWWLQKFNAFILSIFLISTAVDAAPRGQHSLDINSFAAINSSRGADQQSDLGRIRRGPFLCVQEKRAIENRLNHTVGPLQTFCCKQNSDDRALCNCFPIAALCSGGGMRSALTTLGFLEGLEAGGLLDAVTYVASLSGSTWMIASWLKQGKSFDELERIVKANIKKITGSLVIEAFKKIWAIYKDTNKFPSLTRIYGNLLNDIFLTKYRSYLDDLDPVVRDGQYPIPLFSGVLDTQEQLNAIPLNYGNDWHDAVFQAISKYQWVRFSPFEVWSKFLGCGIPAADIGRTFINGVCEDTSLTKDLGYLLGMLSSFYAASFIEILKYLGVRTSHIPYALKQWLSNIRINPPHIANFVYGDQDHELCMQKQLKIMDAGLAVNIPMPLFDDMRIPFFIICDASENCHDSKHNQVRKLTSYAKKHGIKFPVIHNYEEFTTNMITIMHDDDPYTPVIAYIPIVAPYDQRFPSSKFDYNDDEISTLIGSMRERVIQCLPLIRDALEIALNKRKIQLSIERTLERGLSVESIILKNEHDMVGEIA